MGCNDNNCYVQPVFPYRVVQTIQERNSIPCKERINGMIVTVVGENYKQYILSGGDPCVNASWMEYGFNEDNLLQKIGHVTVESSQNILITANLLNSTWPLALEGFRVTYIDLNNTFMKVSSNRWVMTNNTLIT